MKCIVIALFLAAALVALGDEAGTRKRVLFFSKATSWEHKIVHRDGDRLSYIETAVQKLGKDNNIDFTLSKDGRIFTPENIAKYDAFFFYTSGDLTAEPRHGRGDNYPLMTLEGKKAFLDAIHNGKGFIGCNTAVYTFIEPFSPGEHRTEASAARYTRMIGAGYIGHNEVQRGALIQADRAFPGMEQVPPDYQPVDQWYGFKTFMPDLHVIIASDSARLTGNLYERPPYPIVWARMEGAGRVCYTTMGHLPETWHDPAFLQMLLGGIRWVTHSVDADVTPNIATVTPHANEIPEGARKFIPSNPPVTDPHFPNFKVWHSQPTLVKGFGDQIEGSSKPVQQPVPENAATKHVLFFSKSAGYEHPVAYRDTAWPCYLEREMLAFGNEHQIDFTFTKDGGFFTPENITKYDAFLFYTSGDLIGQQRNGCGDNHPLMTAEGKAALLKSIHDGKGFVGIHCAIDTFSDEPVTTETSYHSMLGARYLGCGDQQEGHLLLTDPKFPGMQALPPDYHPMDQWYALQDFAPDLHVILALDCAKMKGALYSRPSYPVAWARNEGKGRVFYTAMGHSAEAWHDPTFQQILLGGLQWVTRVVDADITANLNKSTPRAEEFPDNAAGAQAAQRTN